MANRRSKNKKSNKSRKNGSDKKRRAQLQADTLEPRILLSATWVDADTGEVHDGPTEGDDIATGSEWGDKFQGLGGADQLLGLGGDDLLDGGDGNDALFGGDGDDTLFGGEGDDVLQGGAGNDFLDGGDGIDTADYSDSHSGVTVNLEKGYAEEQADTAFDKTYDTSDQLSSRPAPASPYGGSTTTTTDKLDGIENVHGSDHDDTIVGDSGANTLMGGDGDDTIYGGAGDDTLEGGAGDDTLDGGEGSDTAVFQGDSSDYSFETGEDGSLTVTHLEDGSIDTLTNVEQVSFADGVFAVHDGNIVPVASDDSDATNTITFSENFDDGGLQ